jgi:hypothetical protein
LNQGQLAHCLGAHGFSLQSTLAPKKKPLGSIYRKVTDQQRLHRTTFAYAEQRIVPNQSSPLPSTDNKTQRIHLASQHQSAIMDRQRDMVFCHECENEWFHDEGGLTCPDCRSDFTEIVSGASLGRSFHERLLLIWLPDRGTARPETGSLRTRRPATSSPRPQSLGRHAHRRPRP